MGSIFLLFLLIGAVLLLSSHQVVGAEELDFQFGNVAPASFIFSAEHLWPPYDLNVDVMEPTKSCDSKQALLCGIQNSIRLVTQARVYSCPELDAGGSRREAALRNVSAGAYASALSSARGFDVFVFTSSGLIMADGLHSELVGEHIQGRQAGGAVPQESLLPEIDWAVKWGGGFVPHISKRLQQDGTPGAVVSYVEACPGSADRIAVSIARQDTGISWRCMATSNQMCAQHNVEALQGLALLELLTAKTAADFSSVLYKMSYSDELKVNDFETSANELSWYGYPGANALRNPSPLEDTTSTWLAHSRASFVGLNASEAYGDSDYTRELTSEIGYAGWNGGGWRYIKAPVQQVKLGAGITWNRTMGVVVLSGFSHRPRPIVKGPLCTECSPTSSLACSLVNAESLTVHARTDMLIPEHSWDRLTNLRWFGASHDLAEDSVEGADDAWPAGFFAAAFSYTGECVAHAGNYSLVGRTSAEIFGNSDAHDAFLAAAATGERWVTFIDNEVPKSAYVQNVVKDGSGFYIITAISRAWAPMIELGTCSSSQLENCSTWNAQALVGGAAGEVLVQYYEDEVVEVVRKMEAREGLFSTTNVGDFRVHLYDEDFGCWSSAEASGIPCPPKIAESEAVLIRSALGSSPNPIAVRIKIEAKEKVAFVFPFSWTPFGEVTLQDFFLAVFVGYETTTPTCASDGDCPSKSSCSSNGRCTCNTNFYTKVSLVQDGCSANLVPTPMTCVEVTGLDCTTESGNIDLARCRLCEEGYFCCKGYATLCPLGQYCPANSTAPKACSRGTVANTTGSSKCEVCGLGSATSRAGSFECTSCMAGTYAGSLGQSLCRTCSRNSYSSLGQASCTECPGGSHAGAGGATSISDCRHCDVGYYFSGRGCHKCFWGLQAPESDATSCTLGPTAQIILICLVSIGFLATTLLLVIKRRYGKRMEALKHQANAARNQKLQQAKECAEEIPFPLALMNVQTFLELTEDQISMTHQDHRDEHRLHHLDTYKSVQAFRAAGGGSHIVFVSYGRIVSLREKTLPKTLYLTMRAALQEVLSENRWEASQTWIWIDRLSVPQDHALMRNLALDSIYMYAKCTDLLLVVCPEGEVRESNSNNFSSLKSYQQLANSRAEVLAHCCAHGPEDVLIFDGSRLRTPTLEWLNSMVYVFEGQYSCCSARGKGHMYRSEVCGCNLLLTPMLALLCDGLRGCASPSSSSSSPSGAATATGSVQATWVASPKTSGLEFFQTKILPEKDRIFPTDVVFFFQRKDASLGTEVRELFGDLPKHVGHTFEGLTVASEKVGNRSHEDTMESFAVLLAV